MRPHLLILVILAAGNSSAATNHKTIPQNPYLVDLVDVLCKNGGKWILAAAGSNGDQPPYRSCVEVTATDTGIQSGCILVAHNHTVHHVKVVKIEGTNEKNETEITSKAPIYQYTVKMRNFTKGDKELRKEIDWDAAISSPMCWNSQTHKIRNIRYIITPIDKTTDHLYLIAVNARLPIPEYQVAILTKTKIRRRYLEKMIIMVNYRNFALLEDRLDSPGLFARHGLPRLQMKCAKGFDMHDPYDTINQYILDMEYNITSPPFPNKDFDTILVKHQ